MKFEMGRKHGEKQVPRATVGYARQLKVLPSDLFSLPKNRMGHGPPGPPSSYSPAFSSNTNIRQLCALNLWFDLQKKNIVNCSQAHGPCLCTKKLALYLTVAIINPFEDL